MGITWEDTTDYIWGLIQGDHPAEDLLQSMRDGYQAMLNGGIIPNDIPSEGVYIGNESSSFRLFVPGDRAGKPFTVAERRAIEGVIGEYDIELEKSTLDLVKEDIQNESLEFMRGFGVAFIEGLEGAYDAIVAKLSGKEPEMVAAITATILVILVGSFLWHEVKRGPRAA